MSSQTLKHIATEPTRLETKRERRRGAAGRAAALRRAPSDSDCSGETASLSADSGDRSVRPPPPPPRSGKNRSSRRRGSEWEVLEGLKDGQRFEKRPEVFNGYLHKKRKWPLKGWHKRFFVIDGGILVYARSPADLARGRLHGSVDVGLSVLSAKARCRRIDIDADEFIYHLRAKTNDVFRTWLGVLEAHRLYRQHLLTFGARESIPKIHAPLEDLPPTDTSSHEAKENGLGTSNASKLGNEFQSNWAVANSLVYTLCEVTKNNQPFKSYLSKKHIKNQNAIEEEKAAPVDSIEINTIADKTVNREYHRNIRDRSPITSQVIDKKIADVVNNKSTASLEVQENVLNNINVYKQKGIQTLRITDGVEIPAYFLFARNRKDGNPLLRKSKKSTNVVKYKNIYDEPTLKRPLSRVMLLAKYKIKNCNAIQINDFDTNYMTSITKKHVNVQTNDEMENKDIQNSFTLSEYDAIAEKLMVSIVRNSNPDVTVKTCINQVIKELYDIKLDNSSDHPVRNLFRCLFEYWLNNTASENYKNLLKQSRSIYRQSNLYFSKDQATSDVILQKINISTQFHGICDLIKDKALEMPVQNPGKKNRLACKINDSFEKERRIQVLERILKNTIYICETVRSGHSKEKDIKITKKLIDNLDNFPRQNDLNTSDEEAICENSNSSNELLKIQETINHLISETEIPPDVAKDFFGAYLNLLRGSYSNDSSSSTEESQAYACNKCDVIAEPVRKKISKSISTSGNVPNPKDQSVDPGQMYLKDVLDNITSIFSKNIKADLEPKNSWNNIKVQDELGRVRPENYQEDSVMIDISKFDLENISVMNDPGVNGIASIIMKLKEKPHNSGECKSLNLNLKYAEKLSKVGIFENNILHADSCESDELFNMKNINLSSVMQCPYLYVQDYIGVEGKELQPYLNSSDSENKIILNEIDTKDFSSISDGTSKAYKEFYQCHNLAKPNTNKTTNDISDYLKSLNDDDLQSCFILSLNKGALTSKYLKKKTAKNEERQTCSQIHDSACSSHQEEIFVEKTPKVVDEKCILILLEHLATLSKNIPNIHKDINNLYLKLRKKHDKIINTSKIQGLGLLGQIYKEEDSFVKATEENESQFDEVICPRAIPIARNDTSTSTSNNFIIKNLIDKAVSSLVNEELPFKSVQVDIKEDIINDIDSNIILLKGNIFGKVKNASSAQTKSFSSLSSQEEVLTTDKATSNQKWYKTIYTRECGMGTLLKCVLDKTESSQNFRLKTSKEITKPENEVVATKRAKNERKYCPQIRQNLIKEITLLSPSFKVSTQSQTEKKLRCLRDKSLNKNYKTYQLYMSNKCEVDKSCSMLNLATKSVISDGIKTLYRCNSEISYISGLVSPMPARGPQAGFVAGTPGGRLAGWILDNGSPLESASRELGQAQLSVQQLQRLLAALELQQQQHHDTDVSLEGASPNVKKDRRKFGLRKKKSSNKCASGDLQPGDTHGGLSSLTAPPSPGAGATPAPALAASLPLVFLSTFLASTLVPAATRPASLPGAESPGVPASLSLTPDHQLREDFTVLAKDLVCSLKGVVATLARERSRARESEAPPLMAALRSDLSTALHLNSELRARLARIHDASDLADVSCAHASRQFQQSLSYSSSCVSASEFFDAEEHEGEKEDEIINADENVLCPQTGVIELDGDSSSEAGSLSSEEGSASSDNSDANMVTVVAEPRAPAWLRRGRLPAPRPEPGGPSLWNLLYKNIGKDLSQISMPVTINEPLNMLQRLCEELEYSELLDAAAACSDAAERAALVASFAVSAYAAAAHRAASKPFNPLLGETYECVRDDRGFRFLAEQVSHHPPISACHASSPRWLFWQEARIKTKFWGKSMEFQPAGRVHVRLATTGDHYSWNKVTTCVHNLFGGQRWVDQYGDMHIVCHGTDVSCKLNFIKASSWSSSRHEVRGAVSWGSRRVRLSGRWSEALHAGEPPGARCLWRPGAMPADHEAYYGFTRFATELNELEPGMSEVLPHTDTRLRPDQRALEEGDVEAAERLKHQLEQAQRERRRDSPEHTPAWFRKESDGGEEAWRFTGEYWSAREAGFPSLAAPRLW